MKKIMLRLLAGFAALAALVTVALMPVAAPASAQEVVRLWPNQPATSPGDREKRAPFGVVVTNVQDATLTVYRPDPKKGERHRGDRRTRRRLPPAVDRE